MEDLGKKKRKIQKSLFSFLNKPEIPQEHIVSPPRENNMQKELWEELFGEESTDEGEEFDGRVNLEIRDENILEHRETSSTRRYRNQWRLLYPWAYSVKLEDKTLVKCEYCTKFRKENIYAREGAQSMQASALKTHAKSEQHQNSEIRFRSFQTKENSPIREAVESMNDKSRLQIKALIECVYFCSCQNLPLEKYPSFVKFQSYLGTPNMPTSFNYSTYVNPVSGREFLLAIRSYFYLELKLNIQNSPFFSILTDESTDRTLEKHLIVYISFLKDNKLETRFVGLLHVDKGDAETIFKTLMNFISEWELDFNKMVGIATDGASVMRGHITGVVSRFQIVLPRLLGIHCIAHREALAIISVSKIFYQMKVIDKLAADIYSWLGKSTVRHVEFSGLLKSFEINDLKVLQSHNVRWLSRGQVMQRLVEVMPAVLDIWSNREKKSFELAIIFQVQFFINLLADVLLELNKLNEKFQRHVIDITEISRQLDSTISVLKRRFLRLDRQFGEGSKYVSSFLEMTKDGYLEF